MHINTTARRHVHPPHHHTAARDCTESPPPRLSQHALAAGRRRAGAATWSRLVVLGGCRATLHVSIRRCKDGRRFKRREPGTGVLP
jgi:hypothetical protein